MTWRVIGAAALLALVVLVASGCGGSASSKPLRLKLTLAVRHPTRPFLIGSTNLPPGTSLGLEIESKAARSFGKAHPNKPNPEYVAQADATVNRDGNFRSTRFSDHGDPLPPGRYLATVALPYSVEEPKNVQAVLGKKGENLRGPLVSHDNFGEATAEKSVWFTVP